MAKRYEQMLRLIEQVKPRAIVEIGVHKGVRAEKLCREALLYSSSVKYVGYDVFDSEDEKFQADALNGKGAPSKEQASNRLKKISGLMHALVTGDTRVTLAGKKLNADFAFIDGDHRLDVIRGDYEAVKDAICVVFDDFYVSMVGGYCPVDLRRYGCNGLIEELVEEGRRVEILPVADRCNHGAYTKLAVVWK